MAPAPDGQSIRTEVWNKRIRAKMHALFFTRVLSRRLLINRIIQIAIAMLSSGAFVTVLFLEPHTWAPWLAAVTAVFSIAALGFFPPSDIAKLSRIADHWKLRVHYWDATWARVERKQYPSDAELDAARADDDRLNDDEAHFRITPKAKKRVQAEVMPTVVTPKAPTGTLPPKGPENPQT